MILPNMPDFAGPRMVEKYIKPAGFSIANPKLPSPGPPVKKQRINLNTPPNSYNQPRHKPGSGRGRGGGRYSGGSYSGGRYAVGRPRGSPNHHIQQQRPGGQGGNQQANWNSPTNNWAPQGKQQYSPNMPRQGYTLAPGQKVCGPFGQTSTGQEPLYIPTPSVVIQETAESPLRPCLLSFLDN